MPLWFVFAAFSSLAGATRIDGSRSLVPEASDVGPLVDCSKKKPKPAGVPLYRQVWYSHGDEFLLIVVDLPPLQCNWHFLYFYMDDAFVAPQRWKGMYRNRDNPEPQDICVIRAENEEDPRPEWKSQVCKAPKGGNVWNYAEEFVNDRCKHSLCHSAKSGQWKGKGWFNHAKETPWHATESEEGSYGYVYEFHQKCTWKGPPSFGDLLGSFNDFAARQDLITHDGSESFNKTICGCKTADDCS
mmetsp:Transcript_63234/g.100397  ORF Transcript_63234/g.100397 Transcript_63234/m.100397 type:complete len:243 (+) Transcript_63234:72-800(+)